ncbi:hypothetical protein llap_5726 [Limosa lapponica baueri]|uniref:Uncharacterized protein n=1 Tax=Limosa lapponica baueri TaxID=1758121 RepID=A0A2I0UD36_LIMLA|nr:hypothetical protein llap_5726 [Limosa lapponica baueri]
MCSTTTITAITATAITSTAAIPVTTTISTITTTISTITIITTTISTITTTISTNTALLFLQRCTPGCVSNNSFSPGVVVHHAPFTSPSERLDLTSLHF